MPDTIIGKDGAGADVPLGVVKLADGTNIWKHVQVDQFGNFISYNDTALIGGYYSSSLTARTAGQLVSAEMGKYAQQLVSEIDNNSGIHNRHFVKTETYWRTAGSAAGSGYGTFSQDGMKGVVSYGAKNNARNGRDRSDAVPSQTRRFTAAEIGSTTAIEILNFDGTSMAGGMIGRMTGRAKKTAGPVFIKFYDQTLQPTASDTPIMSFEYGPVAAATSPEKIDQSFDSYIVQTKLWVRFCAGEANNDNTALATTDITSLQITSTK